MEEKSGIELGKLKEGNISLILDTYDDIFSDFDPRPYTIRALSDDFLLECKKATADKEEKIELRFLVPKKIRNHPEELKIKKRLKDHFMKHYHLRLKEVKKLKLEGIGWFFGGAIVLTLGALLLNYQGFFYNLLFTISEPAGWFFFWQGLEKIFIEARSRTPDVEFNRKMAHSDIIFIDY